MKVFTELDCLIKGELSSTVENHNINVTKSHNWSLKAFKNTAAVFMLFYVEKKSSLFKMN